MDIEDLNPGHIIHKRLATGSSVTAVINIDDCHRLRFIPRLEPDCDACRNYVCGIPDLQFSWRNVLEQQNIIAGRINLHVVLNFFIIAIYDWNRVCRCVQFVQLLLKNNSQLHICYAVEK